MIVIARRSGRLGNRLFSFAHFIANSMEHGRYRVLCPVLQEYASFFAAWNNSWLCGFPEQSPLPGWLPASVRRGLAKVANALVYGLTNPIRRGRIAFMRSPFHDTIDLHHPDKYDWQHSDYLDFVQQKIVIANGWVFWDHQNFIRHADELRRFFRLPENIERNVQAHVQDLRTEAGRTVVGIHMRRGDYATHCDGSYFYSWEEYRRLMQRIRDIFGDNIVFLLCSDEAIPVENFSELTIGLGPGSAVEDMYSLAQCDYIVGPPSSFSGWASFIGKAPLYYIGDIAQAIEKLTREDFTPMTSFDYEAAANNYRWVGE